MKELMIHVERIVRPVWATSRRRLHMRQELLGHLQGALNEERRRFPDDESAAIEAAKRRLGEPDDLTRQLQRTVPWLERVLMARTPASSRITKLELWSARSVLGMKGPMAMGHAVILEAFAVLQVVLPIYLSADLHDFMTGSGASPVHFEAFFMALCVGIELLSIVSFRFAYAAAAPAVQFSWTRVLKWGGINLAIQVAMLFFATAAKVDRQPAIGEIAVCAGASVVLLAILVAVARRIGVARLAYDEWFELSVGS